MNSDVEDFVQALERFVRAELARTDGTPEYSTRLIRVVDARGHLFASAGRGPADEAAGVYPLRDFFLPGTELQDFVPNRGRLLAVARDYFGPVAG